MALDAETNRWLRSIERGQLDPFEREFEADEEVAFLDNLCLILGDYLNPYSAAYWSCDFQVFSDQWKLRAQRRHYIERATDRASSMVNARGWDPTPLFWVKLFISELTPRDSAKVEEIFHLLNRLSISLTGASNRNLRFYDEETAADRNARLETREEDDRLPLLIAQQSSVTARVSSEDGEVRAAKRSQLVTLDQVASVIGLTVKTINNRLSESRKPDSGNRPPDPIVPKSGSAPSQYDWRQIRPWLLKAFPARASAILEDFPSPIEAST